MLKSMTGYGKGEAQGADYSVTVEIRTVNHRFSDVSIKAPRFMMALENGIRKAVAASVNRGKVDIFFQVESTGESSSAPQLNHAAAAGYMEAFRELISTYGLSQDVPLSLLAGQKDVVVMRELSVEDSEVPGLVDRALNEALENLQQMREKEGEAMKKDVSTRLQNLRQLLDQVGGRAPLVVEEWRLKLQERLDRLPEDVSIDPQRVAQEVAVFADRCDISEELARFASHLDQYEGLLDSAEPIGRKMDFIAQELNREANTMGSKSNDADLTQLVVAIKAELEKVREQIQNLE